MSKPEEKTSDEECDSIGTQNDILKRKKTTDFGDKTTTKFQCADCTKSFNSKQNLTKHSKLHDTWIFVFHCSCCNYSFKSKEYITKHLKRKGIDAKSIICTMSYVNAITLKAVGESKVIELGGRSLRTKRKQTMNEYKKLAEAKAPKLSVQVYTKSSSELNRITLNAN